MVRYLGWLANTALFTLCCFLVANTANAIIAALLSQSPALAVELRPRSGPQSRTWNDRQQITQRNLFHSAKLSAPASTPAPTDEELKETELPLKLWGTIAAEDPALSWASVEETGKKRRHLGGSRGRSNSERDHRRNRASESRLARKRQPPVAEPRRRCGGNVVGERQAQEADHPSDDCPILEAQERPKNAQARGRENRIAGGKPLQPLLPGENRARDRPGDEPGHGPPNSAPSRREASSKRSGSKTAR